MLVTSTLGAKRAVASLALWPVVLTIHMVVTLIAVVESDGASLTFVHLGWWAEGQATQDKDGLNTRDGIPCNSGLSASHKMIATALDGEKIRLSGK